MNNEYQNHVANWLNELEEYKAVEFLKKLEFGLKYVDTGFSLDGSNETDIYILNIYVPLKLHKKLNDFSEEISAIESAIFESAQTDNMYFKETNWSPYLRSVEEKKKEKRADSIKKLLTFDYVNNQINLMNESIESSPYLALGISKELIETCCKHVLAQNSVSLNKEWDLPRLVKETNRKIDLIPFAIQNKELAVSSIRKILSGLSVIVHGITELRNTFGNGHGHTPDFKSLDLIYIKLAVSASSEFALFYLRIHDLNIKIATANKR